MHAAKRNPFLAKFIPDRVENIADALLPDSVERVLNRGASKVHGERGNGVARPYEARQQRAAAQQAMLGGVTRRGRCLLVSTAKARASCFFAPAVLLPNG